MEDEKYYRKFMLDAIELAKQAKWLAKPNPCVGAILLKDGVVLAEGWHKGVGYPHAEVETLSLAKQKGIDTTGATLVVTLEPCNHYGQNPPCTEAIIEAKLAKVVIGTRDPNPKATGGVEKLEKAGIQVINGVLEQDCLDLINDFTTWQNTPYPCVFLKLASTLDGRIATRTGHSQWISSPESRQAVHLLRYHMDAVLIGSNTFYADNPKLTCRVNDTTLPEKQQPLAVVVTSCLPEANHALYLLQQRPHQTIFWTSKAEYKSQKAKQLSQMGVRVFPLDYVNKNSQGKNGLDIKEGLKHLRYEFGCHHVLCEGGGRLGLSLLEQKLVNEMHLYLAPKILGDNQAAPLFDGKAPERLEEALQLRITKAKMCGDDLLLELHKHR